MSLVGLLRPSALADSSSDAASESSLSDADTDCESTEGARSSAQKSAMSMDTWSRSALHVHGTAFLPICTLAPAERF